MNWVDHPFRFKLLFIPFASCIILVILNSLGAPKLRSFGAYKSAALDGSLLWIELLQLVL